MNHTLILFLLPQVDYFKPKASQVIHFPIQPTHPLTFKTSENAIIFPSTPHQYFNSRFNSIFNFVQVYENTNPEPNSCSVIIQIVTHNSAIFSPGYIGSIEVPATNIKPPYYKVDDASSLLHTMYHSYYPGLAEPKPPVRRSSLKRTKIEINNLQPYQLLHRPLPSLLYSQDFQHFLKKFKFQNLDDTDEEYLKLCANLVKHQHCYATHRNDVRKMATPFTFRLEPNAKLQIQRPTKVPNHYRGKLKNLLGK